MISDIGAGDIAAYRRDGYVKIAGFLDSAELAQLRDTIEAAVAARTERIPGFADAGVTGDAYYDNVFKQRVNLWRTDESTRRFILDERIGGIAARLEDQPAMRLYHDQALFKGPWANPSVLAPRQSLLGLPFAQCDDDLDRARRRDLAERRAAVHPGSHLSARYDNVRLGPNVGALFEVYPQWAALNATCVELKAGDATFHNGLLAHAAGPNMTPRPRRAYAAIL